jgi:hypothetical protein
MNPHRKHGSLALRQSEALCCFPVFSSGLAESRRNCSGQDRGPTALQATGEEQVACLVHAWLDEWRLLRLCKRQLYDWRRTEAYVLARRDEIEGSSPLTMNFLFAMYMSKRGGTPAYSNISALKLDRSLAVCGVLGFHV